MTVTNLKAEQEKPGQTLEATGLVHGASSRLMGAHFKDG